MQPTSSISITFPADKTPAPFGNSRISVGVGNTIVSFAFFGVGPSIAAYAILKVLEENEETWNEVPCLRITVDQSGSQDGKIISTVWLRQEDGTPLRGEIAVDGEIILTAEFTSFAFYDTIENQET